MKEYYYYSVNDVSKEQLGTVRAKNRLDAIHMFSKRKRLNVFSFLELFVITEKNKYHEKSVQ
jgi:hypothetical protein